MKYSIINSINAINITKKLIVLIVLNLRYSNILSVFLFLIPIFERPPLKVLPVLAEETLALSSIN